MSTGFWDEPSLTDRIVALQRLASNRGLPMTLGTETAASIGRSDGYCLWFKDSDVQINFRR